MRKIRKRQEKVGAQSHLNDLPDTTPQKNRIVKGDGK